MQIRSVRTFAGSSQDLHNAIAVVRASLPADPHSAAPQHSAGPQHSASPHSTAATPPSNEDIHQGRTGHTLDVAWPVGAVQPVRLDVTPCDGPSAGGSSTGTSTSHQSASGNISTVAASIAVGPFIPYFFWFTTPILYWFARRQLRWTMNSLQTVVEGGSAPAPLALPSLVPAGGYTRRQAYHLATVGAIAALCNYGGSLLTQNLDLIGDTFDATDGQLGVSLAVVRGGILISLVAAALADRQGRRRMLLVALLGVGLASLATVAAPNLAVLTACQTITRAFVNVAVAVGAISVVEEAPERGRAASIALFGLATSAGFAASVLMLPLVGSGEKWRLSYLLAAGMLVLVPHFARVLQESRRFEEIRAAPSVKRGLSHLLTKEYRSRLLILAAVAALGNVLAAPAAQFINRYLADDQGFSPLDISVFRVVTAGLSGLFGIILGGRFAERYGRRVVGSVGFAAMSISIAWFYLAEGPALWVASTCATFLAGLVAPAMGAFTSELFPTESRGTSNAVFLGSGVLGSVTGLLVAGTLSDRYDDLGLAIAALAVVPLLMAVLLIPRLPEPAGNQLDDLSPSIIDNVGM
ncbi:MAG: MFS transporter [Actinobacteria bacterium]|nr:MFS transporter [Actinomycetota bacterium]MCB9388905.1 MFS transporter [Acidimicrobiia bacterium]